MDRPVSQSPRTSQQLPDWSSALAVVAHPDDESFGLGAVLAVLAEHAAVHVLCLTRGEASSLHGVEGDLARLRPAELAAASRALGLAGTRLRDFGDGRLADRPRAQLTACVVAAVRDFAPEGLVVFDPSGVTGHPDHRAATAAALAAAEQLDLPVLAWTVPEPVAAGLNAEFGATFTGHVADDIDVRLRVERSRQRAAIDCHASQAVPTSVLWRRLELLGDHEHLRWVRRTRTAPRRGATPSAGEQ